MQTKTETTFDPNLMPARDKDGWVEHPHVEMFLTGDRDDESTVINNELLAAAGFRATYITMEDDLLDSHPARVRYFDDGEPDVSGWEPVGPRGYMLAAIFATEDTPVAMFVGPLA